MNEKLGKIDKLLNKAISRKLLVWLASIPLLYFGKLDAANWVTITMVYIGAQAAVDVVEKLKGN
jgi:hypothetical protein